MVSIFVALLLTIARILIQNKLQSNKTIETCRSNVAIVATSQQI